MKWLDRLFPAQAIPEEEGEYTPAPQIPFDTARLEPGSETWRFVQDYAQGQIASLRAKNDSDKLDPTQTAALRGQIKALKKLITLDKPKADNRRLSVEDED
jgi:hypothetical protein